MRKKVIVIVIVLILALLLAGPVLARATHDYHIWLMNQETAWVLCTGEIQVEKLGAQSAKVWCEP